MLDFINDTTVFQQLFSRIVYLELNHSNNEHKQSNKYTHTLFRSHDLQETGHFVSLPFHPLHTDSNKYSDHTRFKKSIWTPPY